MLSRLRYPLLVWLFTHVAIAAIAGVTIFLWPHLYLGDLGSRPAALTIVDGLCAWDCREYANIAADGYGNYIHTNFWPMLPLLARPLVWLHLQRELAIVIVANVASLIAYVSIYRVFEILDGEEAARWGLALFAAYPFAFFFGVGYTEPIMVAAMAGGMWLALTGRHVWANVAFAGGVLARVPATLGWLGLAAVQLRDRTRWRTRAALLIPVAVTLLWLVFCWVRFGNPLSWTAARHYWGWHSSLNVIKGMRRWHDNARMLLVYPPFALIPGAGVVALVTQRRWWPLASFAVPLYVIFCAMGAYGLGRYSASLWPAFLPLGVWLARRPSLQTPVLLALTLFQGLFLHLFAHAYELQ